MNRTPLENVARALVPPGKGILAADESTGTIAKRFQAIALPSTEASRQAYRQMLFTAPALGDFISGVILFDETIRQNASDGTPFVQLLAQQGILPGIKVDKGAKPLAQFPEETVTEGLDGLRGRLEEYAKMGARFTKWRAVIRIGDGLPTSACLAANAHALGRFAALSQEAGLVPIVEPEVLMDGSHTLERCEAVTTEVLRVVFSELAQQRVAIEAMLLKINMVTAGKDCQEQPGIPEVAGATVRCLRRVAVPALPGIVFLSGGMSGPLATQRLNAINKIGDTPWPLSFSFGRALQDEALQQWHGENVPAGQQALLLRARCNSAALDGKYSEAMESKQTA
jgi:fructose-bisphosphate aldolase class I